MMFSRTVIVAFVALCGVEAFTPSSPSSNSSASCALQSIWYSSQLRSDELRAEWRRSDKDTGSPVFQVAGMTERVTYLSKHLQQRPKDYLTRRGLVALVNKRRRLLNFLAGEDSKRYVAIIDGLGIRQKAPGRVPSRDDKYGRYPLQKAVKKNLKKK